MNYWNELRIAYLVGLHGTATAAAKVQGVHRTTVIRQLDFLERELQQKLFIRHNKGITLNEAGKTLMQALQNSDQQLTKAISVLKGNQSSLSGELIISSVDRAFTLLSVPFRTFLLEHPDLRIKFETAPNNLKLEYGEVHIVILPGMAPTEPDFVVQKLGTINLAMYASKTYISRYGMPKSEEELKQHKFATAVFPMATKMSDWFDQNIPKDAIAFECNEPTIVEDAVAQGLGMGLMLRQHAASQPDLVEVMPTRDAWSIPLWLVTHGDQHRVPKVQACVTHLKAWSHEML